MSNTILEKNGIIEPAVPEQALLLSDLAMRSKAYWGYDEQFLEACRDDLRITSKYIATCHVYVLRLDDRIIGFYGLRWHPDNTIELADLFIDPEFIGQGYGSQLWQHAVQLADRLGCQALFVSSDPHAEDFYKKMGAQRVGEVYSTAITGRVLPLLQYAF